MTHLPHVEEYVSAWRDGFLGAGRRDVGIIKYMPENSSVKNTPLIFLNPTQISILLFSILLFSSNLPLVTSVAEAGGGVVSAS